jgi:uracil-DNA glycosylase family 4
MNTGFFSKKETESKTRPDGKNYSCVSCGLYKGLTTPKMKPYGNFKKGILNIGEAPGEIDDEEGKPWQGKTGKALQRMYKKLGVDLFEDCLNINACHCMPLDKHGDNRAPVNFEIDCCRKETLRIIDEYKPKVIILLGNSAVYSLIGHRWKNDLGGITKWRGWTIPDQDFNAWLCPTFHPSFVERDDTEMAEVIWKQDLEQAFKKIEIPVPRNIEPRINIKEDLSILTKIPSIPCTRIAFDYETTGKKPHAVGHRIVCASVAVSEDNVFVFMMPKTREGRQPFIDLLTNPMIEKVSHNMKFEEAWSVVRLRQPVNNWYWDTMQAAHLLDNRPGINSLKFQVYVNFGTVDYSSEIAPYLQSVDDKNGNALNRIFELVALPGGKEKLMTYCALDSIWTYRLATKQMDLIEYDLPF